MSWSPPGGRVDTHALGPGSASRAWRQGGVSWRGLLGPGADSGSVPVLAALLVLALVFQAANPHFLSADNLVNLSLQVSAIGVMALGMVLVLLVGQVDLSVGAVSGLAAAIVAVGAVHQGWPLAVAVAVAIVAAGVIGAGYGWMFTRVGVPSFVLTLAGLLVAQGLQERVLGSSGSITLPFDSPLVRFSQQSFLAPALAYGLVAAGVVGGLGLRLLERRRRVLAELPVDPLRPVLVRWSLLGAVAGSATWYLNLNRGIGASFALFLALVLAADILLRRTRWGRSVRAVGSNVGSAHRAGIAVRRVYVATFTACAALAGLGGVLAAGRLAAANQGTGGSDTNLTVIAAAVIGGTSLFGGRGSAWSALLGALVVGSISSGLTLLNLDAAPRYIVTGMVLALAVTVDALGRRRVNVADR
ncbi:sugar ABC transporter permease [Actinotalea sp.]|uniref:sugar ABC transporter permease n=1 Tax=Actinotalea sp. TaxID=1872145 RepID=UPI00356291E6